MEASLAMSVSMPYGLKHVVGSSLFGSPGGHGGREFSSVVRFYPDVKVIATWHSKTASTRIC